MKIVADENIPLVNDLFSPLGEVILKPGRSMQAQDLVGAEILLVRSVTKVNEALLKESNIRFVGTCTIGMDHIDTQYLDAAGIAFASAPGCNANAVVQYVVSALAQLQLLDSKSWPNGRQLKAVVVGGGNVGSRVYRMLAALGFNCRCVDPFLDPKTCAGKMQLAPFDAVYDADIVCVHTPLTFGGPHPTHHLFGVSELLGLKDNTVLLNAGRGEVIDNAGLLDIIASGKTIRAVLDVWENEPNINQRLLQKVVLGTPHIAGYSFEGRVGGSSMIFDALSEFLELSESVKNDLRAKVLNRAFGEPLDIEFSGLSETVLKFYDVADDFAELKSRASELPGAFDRLRKNYPKRREFSHYRCRDVPQDAKGRLLALGFSVK